MQANIILGILALFTIILAIGKKQEEKSKNIKQEKWKVLIQILLENLT